MFKSRTEHFHALLQSNNSFRSAPTNNTKSTNDPNSTSDLFQLDLFIEKLSLDASTLQNTTTPIEISPYLLIKVNGTTKAKTLAKRNNLKPQFNQNFLLSLENPKKDVISICVHDKESGGDLLAQCVLDDLDGYMYGKVTSLVVDLESGAGSSSRASIASSSLFHEGCCGSLFVDVKPLNFGKSSPEQQQQQNANLSNNGKKKQTFDSKLQDEKKKTSASGSTTLTSSSSSSSEKATTSNSHTKNHNNNKPTNLNWDLVKSSTHGEITSQEESHHEMEGTNATTTEKRKSAWFSNNGLNSPSATPTHSESAFQFYDFQSGDEDDLAAAANSSCLIQMEGDKEFAKTKQQFKLLYIMAIDVQMFGERVRKLEELIEKWKLPENDTEKLRLKIQTTIQRAEKKRELLDQFLPKLSKKLPKVTNCKLTLMKLSKIKQQYSEIDQHYVQLVKLRQSLERKHRKKRMEQMMEFDELIDQVMFQPASDQIVSSIAAISSGIKLHNEDSTSARVGSYQKPHKENATNTQQKKRVANTDSSQQQPQTIVNTNSKSTKKNVPATTNDTTTTTLMVDRKTLRKQEQAKQKKQLFQAIEAGAMSSGANQPDHLIRKYEQHQKQIEQAKEQAQQKQIQFILSTADAETIEIEKKIANETKRELEVVERDFAELHEMYEQMNVMLRQQGEGLNIVEKNIQQANEYVKEGTEYVKAASAMTGTGILTGGFTKAAVLRKLLS
ncbi:hypothetical protein C9374_011098 [Naegleria lovaniensis]|uniref:C2 domain-containing protein n=1 Tax=Naegleria lovaniensis TaxID=51637 RepID=A0AA88GEQ0_NAELO|nr:uncharacterized protein C9374_011098 [Naegleria lovaniensis]KAG2374019.1 hypothetical protein C9374_011098 [Naegleria lovaniensis]